MRKGGIAECPTTNSRHASDTVVDRPGLEISQSWPGDVVTAEKLIDNKRFKNRGNGGDSFVQRFRVEAFDNES